MTWEPIVSTDIKSVRDLVYDRLRAAIMEGLLEPGERLIETEVALRFGVSRTPVREALRMLEKDGIVQTLPRRGAVVAGFTLETAIEIYTILSVLEGLVARLAATNITERELDELRRLTSQKPPSGQFDTYVTIFAELNEILNKASRSQRLKQIMDTFSRQLNCVRLVSLSNPVRQSQAWDEHLGIIEALEARDPELAEARARKHVEGAREACYVWARQHSSKSNP